MQKFLWSGDWRKSCPYLLKISIVEISWWPVELGTVRTAVYCTNSLQIADSLRTIEILKL